MTSAHAHRATPAAVRIVLGQSQALYREGLRHLLRRAGFEVLASAGSAPDLLDAVEAHRPDVVVTDAGCGAGVEIRRRFPGMAILLIMQRVDVETAGQLVAGGAAGVGYLLEDRVGHVEHFAAALRRVAAGGSVLHPDVVAALLGHRREPLDDLTAREREVMLQVAAGRSNRGVALRLCVSEHAVEKHMSRILAKLRIPAGRSDHRRVLAVLAVRQAV